MSHFCLILIKLPKLHYALQKMNNINKCVATATFIIILIKFNYD